MPRGLDRRDLDDASFVDAEELASSGSGDIYRSGVVVLSATGSSGQVIVSGWDLIHGDDDDFLQVGDVFSLDGSIPAQVSSSFSVVAVLGTGTFTVSPSITTSVFGTGTFRHMPGAKRVGFNPAGISAAITTGSNVQDAIRDIGFSLGTGVVTGVPPNYHSTASEGTSTTTSTVFQNKLTLPFFTPQSGTFYLLWYNESAVGAANRQYEVRVSFDADTVGLFVGRPSLSNVFAPFAGFVLSGSIETPLAAGAHTASIDFRMVDSSTLTIRRARIGIWRVG